MEDETFMHSCIYGRAKTVSPLPYPPGSVRPTNFKPIRPNFPQASLIRADFFKLKKFRELKEVDIYISTSLSSLNFLSLKKSARIKEACGKLGRIGLKLVGLTEPGGYGSGETVLARPYIQLCMNVSSSITLNFYII